MSALSLVPSPAQDKRNPEVLRIISEGNYTLSSLEKQFGISIYLLKKEYGAESHGRGRPKQPKPFVEPKRRGRPPKEKMDPAIVRPAPKRPAISIMPRLIGVGCGLIALAFGAGNAIMNYRFGASFGQDELSSMILGGLGLAIDGGSLLLLPAAGALGEQRRRGLCLLAFLSWVPFVGLSTVAAMGFSASNIGDNLQGRETIVKRRSDLETELSSAKTERLKITEIRDPASLEQQIQIAQTSVPRVEWTRSSECRSVTISVSCLDLVRLRESKATALRRVDLDGHIHDLSEKVAALPAVASKDPGADHIAKLSFGLIAPDQVENFRVIGFACMPSSSGLLLAFARTLLK